MIYHVSVHGCDHAVGTAEAPFRTINHAAQLARPGDTVLVHDGEYREWVNPKYGGNNDTNRIVYAAAPGEHPVIKGSEIVTDWEHVDGTVWKKTLPNTMFGDWNPYAEIVGGDWITDPRNYDVHVGDVYLNGFSLFEAPTLEDLYRAEKRISGCRFYDAMEDDVIAFPERTIYQWHAQVDANCTTIWCNFQDVNPNEALVEINVRKCCFFPTASGVNYITVCGFEMAHAATPWAPPTSHQFAMIGPNWSKGWIIENNQLHDSKCCAISLGKEASTGHNLFTQFRRKSGYIHQMEAVFLGLQAGWCKEKIGSHIVRNNEIYDCGQNGITGHMGCAFSRIEHNHIYRIAKKHEFWGHEIAGIKFHAPVDTIIANNNIHDCTLGTWLDWQIQGVRMTGNLYHRNDRDLMVEVTHGPLLLDNNLFLSKYAFDDLAQGTAIVHNLITGIVYNAPIRDRATPFHYPHSTQVAGFSVVYGGDNRMLNNLFPGTNPLPATRYGNFTAYYDRYTTPEEFHAQVMAADRGKDHEIFMTIRQPVWIEGNAYAGFAMPFRAEKNAIVADHMDAYVEEQDGKWVLTLTVPENVASAACTPVTTQRLGAPRLTEALYENPDGTPIDFTRDYFCAHRDGDVVPGPFAKLTPGTHKLVVWES